MTTAEGRGAHLRRVSGALLRGNPDDAVVSLRTRGKDVATHRSVRSQVGAFSRVNPACDVRVPPFVYFSFRSIGVSFDSRFDSSFVIYSSPRHSTSGKKPENAI